MDGAVLLFLRVGVCTGGAGISSACMHTGRWGSPSNPIHLYRGGGGRGSSANPVNIEFASI